MPALHLYNSHYEVWAIICPLVKLLLTTQLERATGEEEP